jgi:hypothetical protein
LPPEAAGAAEELLSVPAPELLSAPAFVLAGVIVRGLGTAAGQHAKRQHKYKEDRYCFFHLSFPFFSYM